MAYNSSKGPQTHGDVKFEGDAEDTQIDFETDLVALKTNGVQRFIVSGSFITSSVPISSSGGITGPTFTTPTTVISSAHISSSLNISGSKFYANGVLLGPGAVSAVANGADNRVATFSSADALNGEANLTFDGTDLGVSDKVFHVGDTDTFINFTTDDINFQAGGVNFLDLTEDTQNEVTFNEEGVDIDFRVETADESHMLFIEGSSNRMSIGDNTGSPGATLEVKNHASAGATGVPLVQLNNNDTDEVALDINASNVDANVVDILADSVTTAKVINVSADGLTTGNAIRIGDNSSNTGTRQTALIVQNNAAAIAATALTVQSDGGVTGVKLDKNYSDTAEASVVGLDIDWDKTGASTTNNTMYGIQLDMDNTTATNGNNTMYGLHVTPTLTHAADAGTPIVKGAVITATAGSNGTSTATGMELTSTGADTNEGLIINCADGGTDLKIVSSADTGDYFQIQTTTNGATSITTVDDNATAAHLTFNVDGDITLDPAGGVVAVDGNLSASLNISASSFYANGVELAAPAIASYTNSGDNRIITSVNSNTINAESRLTFNGSTNFLFLSGNAQITNHIPTIFFSNSAGTGLGYFGYNNSDNILLQNNVTNKHIVLKANDNGTIREGFRIDGAVPEVVINQGSDSLVDFRVESNDNTHMIFSDGSANRVGINSSAPTHTLSVSGSTSLSGSTFVTGSLTGLGPIRGQQLYYTHHHFAGAGNNSWFPFTGNIESSNANEVHAMVVPHDGRLVKILFRVETKQNTSFTLKLYKGVDGVKEMDTAGSVEVEAITATLPNTDATTVTFATSGAIHYNAGDIVGIQMGTFTTNTGDVQATCVWEYDQLIP